MIVGLTSSLLLGCIGAALTYLLRLAIRLTRERLDQDLFPVSGTFVTEFEDLEDGLPVLRRATTVLRQKGTEVFGLTTELGSGRSWHLKGSVERGGFLHGAYTADDPHDAGRGTFFFSIGTEEGELDGLWAGYDSRISGIAGGRYRLRRRPDLELRKATPDDAAAIVALLGGALGERYVRLEQIRALLADENRGAAGVAVSQSGELVGAVTSSWLRPSELRDHLPAGQEGLVEELDFLEYHARAGHIEAVAVAPAYRGRGLATQLVERAVGTLEDGGATAVISFGWEAEGQCAIAGILQSQGFGLARRVENFWGRDNQEEDYDCPSCGDRCRCAGLVFSRPLPPRVKRIPGKS